MGYGDPTLSYVVSLEPGIASKSGHPGSAESTQANLLPPPMRHVVPELNHRGTLVSISTHTIPGTHITGICL